MKTQTCGGVESLPFMKNNGWHFWQCLDDIGCQLFTISVKTVVETTMGYMLWVNLQIPVATFSKF